MKKVRVVKRAGTGKAGGIKEMEEKRGEEDLTGRDKNGKDWISPITTIPSRSQSIERKIYPGSYDLHSFSGTETSWFYANFASIPYVYLCQIPLFLLICPM